MQERNPTPFTNKDILHPSLCEKVAYNIYVVMRPTPHQYSNLHLPQQLMSNFRILMFPWLAHGHIFPFLQLAKRIVVQKNFHVYLCTTAVNFPSIHSFIRSNGLDRAVDLVELHLEPSPELPPHYHTTKNLPPHLNFTLLKAFQTAKSSFSEILAALRPDLLLYDVFQPWAPKLASSRGIPAVHFSVTGAATKAFTHHRYVRFDDGFPFPELCPEEHEISDLDALYAFCRDNVFGGDTDVLFASLKLSSEAVVLMKTSRCLAGKYADYVSAACQLNLLPVGPLVAETDPAGEDEDSENLLLWLSTKPRHSTVYVSFGSECFLSKAEIQELATGLELCAVNFIWVLRPPPGENAITLPEGFLDRVQNRGMVVSGWVPQTRILAHPSTGAFVSHCGWSSVTESIWFGVPVVCMPMKIIMFVDANFLVAAGAGVRVPRKGEGEGYKGKDVAEVINEVVVGKSGADLRRRAVELSEKMRREEGEEMDGGADHLWQLCLKNQGKVMHDDN